MCVRTVHIKENERCVLVVLVVVVYDQQDEFLMKIQTKLQAEIDQSCLINSKRHSLKAQPLDMSSAEAEGASGTTAALVHTNTHA